jgi:hypothetical protein
MIKVLLLLATGCVGGVYGEYKFSVMSKIVTVLRFLHLHK